MDASTKANQQLQDLPLQNEKKVLLFFTADWSGASCMMKNSMEMIQLELGDTIQCIWLDYDKNPALIAELNIREIPSILLLDGTTVSAKIAGMTPRFQLLKTLAAYLELPAGHPWHEGNNHPKLKQQLNHLASKDAQC